MARPRSQHAHQQVLDAAIALFSDRGIDATSMDAIAEASGVSKATIYNHWADKEALCLEVLIHLFGLDEPRPRFDSGDLRADLLGVLSIQPKPESVEARKRIFPHLIAYSARNEEFGIRWRTLVMEPTRTELPRILTAAMADGGLSPSLDTEIALALLLGPLFYLRVYRMDLRDLPVAIVDTFLAAHARPFAGAGYQRTPNDTGI